MALTLNLSNFSPNNIVEQAKVASDCVKGITSIPLDNAQNFQVGNPVLVGKIGGSQTHLYTAGTVDTGDILNISAGLDNYVERGTEVTRLFGNSLRIYYAVYTPGVIPADTDYQFLEMVAIDPDQLTTQYLTPDGFDDYWWKYTFFDTTTGEQTPLKASKAVRDTSSTDYASVDEVRREAGFEGNNNVTNGLIYRKLQAAQAKVNGMLSGRYVLPLGQPVNPIIADLTVRLAAGYTMIAEYGTFDGQDKSKGEKLRDDAISELKDYQSGSQVITDLQAVSVELPDAGGFESGYSADNPLGFSRDDIVGYTSRVY